MCHIHFSATLICRAALLIIGMESGSYNGPCPKSVNGEWNSKQGFVI